MTEVSPTATGLPRPKGLRLLDQNRCGHHVVAVHCGGPSPFGETAILMTPPVYLC